jgi:pyrroloquinoline quinone biosynthesis protein E
LSTFRPFTLIAELTHRCPLACGYCSNPVGGAGSLPELALADWQRVFREAEALGVVQVHLTGGEPLVRTDLTSLVVSARATGLYTNLVTSGLPHSPKRFQELALAGLEHVQLSVQAPDAARSDRIAGRRAFEDKLRALEELQATGMAITLNVVLHRDSIDEIDAIIELAVTLGVRRLELAHAQYQGYAFHNRDALLPSATAVERARKSVRAAKSRLEGRLEITHVLPDHHSDRPRACMDGWGRRYIHVSPDGTTAPCHAAASIAGLPRESVREHSLSWLWNDSQTFNAFRGTAWMGEPCRTCPRREVDFGGCRCQAFALTGDAAATDPACALAPAHHVIERARADADELARSGDAPRLHRPRADPGRLVTLGRRPAPS